MEKYKAAIQSFKNLIMVGFLIKPNLNWSSGASWSCIFQGRMQISDFCTQRATWALSRLQAMQALSGGLSLQTVQC